MKKINYLVICSIVVALLLNLSTTSSSGTLTNNQDLIIRELGQIDTGGEAWDVQVVGNIAYVVDIPDNNLGGLVIIDVSDPTNPQKLSQYYDGGLPSAVYVAEDRAYVADGEDGLEIFDVRDPGNPIKLSQYHDGGDAYDVQVVGDLAYVAAWENGLEILDVSDPAHPTKVGQYSLAGVNSALSVVGDLAYVIDHSGMKILNISDPSHPVELGKYAQSSLVWCSVDLSIPYLEVDLVYVAKHHKDTGGLKILNVSDPSHITEVGQFDDGGTVQRTYVEGDIAYVADASEGLEILNVSDPANPTELGQYYDGGAAFSVYVIDNIVYVADVEDGLEIIQVEGLNKSADTTTVQVSEIADSLGVELLVLVGLFTFLTLRREKGVKQYKSRKVNWV